MTEDTNGEHANDDDNRGDLLLEEPAAQQRDGHGRETGDQLVEVGLECGDLVDAQAGGAKRAVLGQRALNGVRHALAAAVGGLGDGVPVDVGTLGLGDRGDNRGELDGHPRGWRRPR